MIRTRGRPVRAVPAPVGHATILSIVGALLAPQIGLAEGPSGLGAALYSRHCASCHGAYLEGQPDWTTQTPDGTWPAPPHSAEGHTWHHTDALLRDYVQRGGQALMDEKGIAFRSGMPAFEGTLTPAEIDAVLGFIRSTWPPRVHAAQRALQ